MNFTSHHAIGACQPASADNCQNELLSMELSCRVERWLDPGTPLIALPAPFAAISSQIAAQKPVFLRHICPAELWLSPEEWQNADDFAAALRPILPSEPICLQLRRAGAFNGVKNAANGATLPPDVPQLAAALAKIGVSFGEEGRVPGHDRAVLSGVVTADGGFFGVSRAFENLSPYAGGNRHFPDGETLSRAGHKLSEALEVFSLSLPKGQAALDLGASPGGWSKVLLEHGMAVTAVDPAGLDASLQGRVAHFAGLAQDFAKAELSKKHPVRFSVMVNDMRMDAVESAKVMVSLAPLLTEGGLAVMTFKLPERGKTTAIKKGMTVMGQAFTRENARQLFHNRSEITAVFRKK